MDSSDTFDRKTLSQTSLTPLTAFRLRKPEAKDGQAIQSLVKSTGVLDANAEYAYVLLGAHFAGTCVLAEDDNGLTGFVSAYRLPDNPDVLFVWQIAVGERARRKGLGLAMVRDLLSRPNLKDITMVHATIASSNAASIGLFRTLADFLQAPFETQPFFPADYFSKGHEAEPLITIGPFDNNL
jgi:L-2,4-diaminobutyric acid acetyltransferase